jgi:hypothetical protein
MQDDMQLFMEKDQIPTNSQDYVDTMLGENKLDVIENSQIKVGVEYKRSEQRILGEGHLCILHAYTRDVLFKKIKILSSSHLESSGVIMTEVCEKLRFSSQLNGNKQAFMNACKSEIRKAICSRRGYVKKQVGKTLTGKFFELKIIKLTLFVLMKVFS